MEDFDKALGYLFEHEGGLSDVKADRGGRTLNGVTQSTYNSYRRKKALPVQDVAKMSVAERREIYWDGYWIAASCDKLPWPLSYLTFDAAVNSGPDRAKKWLQAGLGLKQDGNVGPKTIAAATAAVANGEAGKILAAVVTRWRFLANLIQRDDSQVTFVEGWGVRMLDVLARSLVEAQA